MSTETINQTADATEAAATAVAESAQPAAASAPAEASAVAVAENNGSHSEAETPDGDMPDGDMPDGDMEDFASILAGYEKEHSTEISENEVVKGTVIKITDQAVIIDVGFKSEGIVNVAEFKDGDTVTVKPGDQVDVYVKQLENSEGYVELSRADAVRMQTWDLIENAYKSGEVIKARVLDRIQGGLRVERPGFLARQPSGCSTGTQS
jgi:small subunit ribosomal protein S1